jgi:signal transduction histidine kinase
MRQVFQNLISNSLKFSREGVPPRITIAAERVEADALDALPAEKGPYCRILLSDNGIGFNSTFSDKIFTIFQRLHGKEEYEGNGIGLAIVKKIVEKHNGSIYVESKENQGTEFIIILPVHQTNIPN